MLNILGPALRFINNPAFFVDIVRHITIFDHRSPKYWVRNENFRNDLRIRYRWGRGLCSFFQGKQHPNF